MNGLPDIANARGSVLRWIGDDKTKAEEMGLVAYLK
jgi:hypothetical protein